MLEIKDTKSSTFRLITEWIYTGMLTNVLSKEPANVESLKSVGVDALLDLRKAAEYVSLCRAVTNEDRMYQLYSLRDMCEFNIMQK